MLYKLAEGGELKQIVAETQEEFVTKMRKTARFIEKTDEDYMEAYSTRASIFLNVFIDPSTPEKFVDSLIRNGLVTKHYLN